MRDKEKVLMRIIIVLLTSLMTYRVNYIDERIDIINERIDQIIINKQEPVNVAI